MVYYFSFIYECINFKIEKKGIVVFSVYSAL